MTPDIHDMNSSHPLDDRGYCTCHGGYLHKNAIDNQVSNWDEEEVDARVLGKFIILRDLVFNSFDANVHVLPEDMTPEEVKERGIQLYAAIDPHMRREPAWGLYGIDFNNVRYVIDEYPNITHGPYEAHGNSNPMFYDKIKSAKHDYEDLVHELAKIEKYWGQPIVKRFMDPRHGHSKVPNTNEMIIEAFNRTAKRLGYNMKFKVAVVGGDRAYGEIASGVNMIRNWLVYDKNKEISTANMPGLFINPRCKNHIRMFNYAKYTTRTGKMSESKAPSEEIEEKFKDFMDDLRYFGKSVPKFKQERDPEERYKYVPKIPLTGW